MRNFLKVVWVLGMYTLTVWLLNCKVDVNLFMKLAILLPVALTLNEIMKK